MELKHFEIDINSHKTASDLLLFLESEEFSRAKISVTHFIFLFSKTLKNFQKAN